jgi:outer membrane protein assembly factor BamE (lipoprotein component of BamABCDE complex)
MDRVHADTSMVRGERQIGLHHSRSHIMKLAFKAVSALAVAAVLGACASLHESMPGEGRLAQIHRGLTQDQVRNIAGTPVSTRQEPSLGETVWIYSFVDNWGYPTEFDVSFNRNSVVADISTERNRY